MLTREEYALGKRALLGSPVGKAEEQLNRAGDPFWCTVLRWEGPPDKACEFAPIFLRLAILAGGDMWVHPWESGIGVRIQIAAPATVDELGDARVA